MVHPVDLKDGEYLSVVLKDGADGAGGQVVWQYAEMTEAAHHLFQHGLVPLRLEAVTAGNSDHRMIWRNEAPNSSVGLHVGYLIW